MRDLALAAAIWGVVLGLGVGYLACLLLAGRSCKKAQVEQKTAGDAGPPTTGDFIDARAILDFYADELNWHRQPGPRGNRSWANCAAMEDKGARARQALRLAEGDLFTEPKT